MNADLTPLRSIHTNTFPAVLNQLGISLVVSTYQAGKLIIVRADGDTINTHFKVFNKPMGVAANEHRIALGTAYQLWEFHNQAPVAQKLEPKGKHDACYLPRQIHTTGDIDIHEMAWAGNEIWFINTRFSCLCTLDKNYSFVPRWRPPFITAYDLQDRCHLNGLGIRDGKPKYVTALGESDTPNGWRQNKAAGGILMDIETNEFLLRGLSMPHSPRWYQGKLWFLESGKGSLSYLELETVNVVTVAQLPGFTRGIEFWNNLAFIGLSQVRESAVFSGIPLTKTLSERICGVWVVNIITGETVAFLRFEEAVQEIFAVSILPGIRFPEIVDWDETLMSNSYVLPDEAVAQSVLPDVKESPHGHYLKGNELYYEGKFEESILAYRRCLELQPDYLPARYNLGVVLGDTEQYESAILELNQVIRNEASSAEAHNSLGFVYNKLQQCDQAIHHYQEAININPTLPKPHHNLGMTYLQVGDYKRGWEESEWRWQTPEFTPFESPHPKWDGTKIMDKTLLLHTEQGAGDVMQFMRFIPQPSQLCGKIIVIATPNLIPILQGMKGITHLRTGGEIAVNAFDYYLALMSLPYVLNITLDNLPAKVPYVDISHLPVIPLPKIKSLSKPKLKVGIAWGGSPTQANDKNRSCKLSDFLPLLQLPGIAFYSLQKGERCEEIKDLPQGLAFCDLSPKLDTFGDTATLMQQLDLVISVDTSIVHLAGALGKPVWTLLSYNADWRWLLHRDDSPWYPTMRLIRQPKPKDWATVFTVVRNNLQSMI